MTANDAEKMVCASCIGESFLSNRIAQSGDSAECDYCNSSEPCWPLSELADVVEAAFERHYTRTLNEPDGIQSLMMSDRESSYFFERDGDQTVWAIGNAIQSDEELANDLQALLEERHSDWDAAAAGEECEFDSNAHYEEITPGAGFWHSEWREFERSLKHETRFFNAEARGHLEEVFNDMEGLETSDGRPLIVEAGPEAEISGFYRARVFFSEDELLKGMERPDLRLGPPPAHLARAGRMNAHGVSVFYGAETEDVALAEVRPPMGSQTLVARFNVLRPLRLLDFTALERIRVDGSIFDPGYAERIAHRIFIGALSRRISRPILPTDEDFEYLPTQAVADYLASLPSPRLDGVLFRSAQTGSESRNVVLFYQASRVADLDIPEGTEVRSHTYMDTSEGPEQDYQVTEWVSEDAGSESPPLNRDPFDFDAAWFDPEADTRDAALAVDTTTLSVKVLRSVTYDTEDHRVSRNRYRRSVPEPF